MHGLRFSLSRIRSLTGPLQSCCGVPSRSLGARLQQSVALLAAVQGTGRHATTSTTTTRNNRRTNSFRTIHTAHKPEHANDTIDQARQLYKLSLGLSRTPITRNAEIQFTLYNAIGAVVSSSEKMSKLDLADRYGLSGRDLRTIDLPSGGVPHILIRDETMLIHMFDLRLLVQTNKVILVHLGGKHVGQEQSYNNTTRVFCQDLEGKLRRDCQLGFSGNLPYELRVLEVALTSVTATLEAEYLLAKEQVSKALLMLDLQMRDKEEGVIHSELQRLLDLVRKLAGIEQRARHVRSAVQDMLNEDQDMADMYLSDRRAGKPHAAQDHQDVEYLLEAYYKTSDTVVQEATSLMGNVQRTEETIRSILDVRRNQIMVLETKIEIVMLGLAAATLVAGLYGMNVVNYSEESSSAFGVLVSLCFVGTILISRYGMRQLRQMQKVHL